MKESKSLRPSKRVCATQRICCFILGLCGLARAQEGFQLKDGDRVVFYGDGITEQRQYTAFVETYTVTRFPRLNIHFVDSGWGNDKVTGGGGGGTADVRLLRDVIGYKPTVMTLMLGMYDGGFRAFDDGLFKAYTSGYEHLIDAVKHALPNLRITAIEPSPFDDATRPPNFQGGYNSVLVRYGQWLKQFGQSHGLNVADLNAPLVKALEKAKDTDLALAQKIIPDRVHPSPGGHLILAGALLKAWNAPATVTAIEIDAAAQRVVNAENTAVSGLVGGRALSWTQMDGSLPMPINWNDPVFALAVRSSDFVKTLDQQLLTVTGLTAPRYALKIDREEIGSFLQEQLAAGINLAVFPTPMFKQARGIQDLAMKRAAVHFARWRQVQVPLQKVPLPHFEAALEDLDKLEAEIAEQEHATAQPKARLYELIPE